MSHEAPKPLSPELQMLIAKADQQAGPTPEQQKLALAAMAAQMGWSPGSRGSGPDGSGPAPPAPAASPAFPPTSLMSQLPVALTSLVIGGVLGAAIHAKVVSSTIPAFPSTTYPVVSAAPSATPLPQPPSVESAPAVVASHDTPAPSTSSAPSSSTVRQPDPDAQLAEERTLVDMARTAVARRNAAAAIQALSRHAQKFPKGQLSEEREALWVQALRIDGSSEEAEARARKFRDKYPDSILSPGTVDGGT